MMNPLVGSTPPKGPRDDEGEPPRLTINTHSNGIHDDTNTPNSASRNRSGESAAGQQGTPSVFGLPAKDSYEAGSPYSPINNGEGGAPPASYRVVNDDDDQTDQTALPPNSGAVAVWAQRKGTVVVGPDEEGFPSVIVYHADAPHLHHRQEEQGVAGGTQQQQRGVRVGQIDIPMPSYNLDDDPFINVTEDLSCWNTIKLYCIGIIMIPLRLVSIVIVMGFCHILASIAVAGLPMPEPGVLPEPLGKGRRAFATFLKATGRAWIFFFGFQWITVKGEPDPDVSVIVANHLSTYEPICIMNKARCTAVSASANAKLPMLGKVIRCVECILVDRDNFQSRGDAASQIKARAMAPKGTWPATLIYPEGTITNGRQMLKFKAGAFMAGVPVQPIIVKQPFMFFDHSWSSTWMGIGALTIRVLSQFWNSVELEFLPAYHPNEEEKRDPNLYAENVRRMLSQRSNIPLTMFTAEDYFVYSEAEKWGIPKKDSAVLGMEGIRGSLGVGVAEMKKLVVDFKDALLYEYFPSDEVDGMIAARKRDEFAKAAGKGSGAAVEQKQAATAAPSQSLSKEALRAQKQKEAAEAKRVKACWDLYHASAEKRLSYATFLKYLHFDTVSSPSTSSNDCPIARSLFVELCRIFPEEGYVSSAARVYDGPILSGGPEYCDSAAAVATVNVDRYDGDDSVEMIAAEGHNNGNGAALEEDNRDDTIVSPVKKAVNNTSIVVTVGVSEAAKRAIAANWDRQEFTRPTVELTTNGNVRIPSTVTSGSSPGVVNLATTVITLRHFLCAMIVLRKTYAADGAYTSVLFDEMAAVAGGGAPAAGSVTAAADVDVGVGGEQSLSKEAFASYFVSLFRGANTQQQRKGDSDDSNWVQIAHRIFDFMLSVTAATAGQPNTASAAAVIVDGSPSSPINTGVDKASFGRFLTAYPIYAALLEAGRRKKPDAGQL